MIRNRLLGVIIFALWYTRTAIRASYDCPGPPPLICEQWYARAMKHANRDTRGWRSALKSSKGTSLNFTKCSESRCCVLKNMKIWGRNFVVIDLLFLFLFVLVLCVVIRTNVVFLVKKPLGPWWDQQKQCGVRFYFVCSAAGRQNFQHW